MVLSSPHNWSHYFWVYISFPWPKAPCCVAFKLCAPSRSQIICFLSPLRRLKSNCLLGHKNQTSQPFYNVIFKNEPLCAQSKQTGLLFFLDSASGATWHHWPWWTVSMRLLSIIFSLLSALYSELLASGSKHSLGQVLCLNCDRLTAEQCLLYFIREATNVRRFFFSVLAVIDLPHFYVGK